MTATLTAQPVDGPDRARPTPPRQWASRTGPAGPHPQWWEAPDMRAALAAHDLSTVLRLLRERHSMTQRAIAARTRQAQSEISEILAGRQVVSYPVLVRFCDGLGIPRLYMGLAGVAPPPRHHRPTARQRRAAAAAAGRRTHAGRLVERWWAQPPIRDAQEIHDLATVFVHLLARGFTSKEIGIHTGLPLDTVRAVAAGTSTVDSHRALVRLCEWLAIPPGLLGVGREWTDPHDLQADTRLPTVWTRCHLRALRAATRLTVREFADEAGVSHRAVSKWEAGHVDKARPGLEQRLDEILLGLTPARRGVYDRLLAEHQAQEGTP